MTNLKNHLDNYLSHFTLEALNQNFWFPESQIGFHLMELDDQVLKLKSEKLKCHAKKIVERLKSIDVKVSALPVRQPQSLHGLIKTWETLSRLEEGPETELVKFALSFQPLHQNHFYACLFDEIFDGLRAKRSFRLHFSKTFLPLIANNGGRCVEVYAQLKSATRAGLLLSVSDRQFKLLSDCGQVGMAVFPHDLFLTRDPETADRIAGLRLKKPSWSRQQKKMPTIKVPMEEVKISKCHIESTLSLQGPAQNFVYIPFEAMKDAVTEAKSLNSQVFIKSIDSIAESVAELAAA